MPGGDDPAPDELPDGYPSGLEVDQYLRDGTTVRFRPIRPSDGDALADFHDGLSSRSVYRRFFFVHPHLTRDEVEHFTHVDYVDRTAFVVVDGDRMVGVGRYERIPGTADAEVAFVVTDDHQHLGIGTLLLDHLADVARGHGVATFEAQTLSDNRDMLGVFLASGFAVETSVAAGTVVVRFPIDLSVDYETARASRRAAAAAAPPPPSSPPSPSGNWP